VYDGDGKRVKSTFNGTTSTYFVGVHYEVTGSTVTKYYYAGAQRIAMRTGGTLKFIIGDHLGSTSLVTDANGNNPVETRYKAWGEVRHASGPTPTDYTYTGQYSYTDDFGLMFYNARWYDSALGRFAQADSIVPDPSNTQAWDRYSYVHNNPLRYVDPTGHILDDGCNTVGCGEWEPKSNADKRNWAFTIMFKGSGKDGAWTTEDWNFYLDNYNRLWRGRTPWKNPDEVTGWDLFALHTKRLASQYGSDQKDQFVRDFALVFAGMSATNSWTEAALDAQSGQADYQYLVEGNQGLPEEYLDDLKSDENQSHHYAGIFFLGYHSGAGGGIGLNLRDAQPGQFNPGDIRLGTVAAIHGGYLSRPIRSPLLTDVSNWIDDMSP
jgi:RHS repeat-associated protein